MMMTKLAVNMTRLSYALAGKKPTIKRINKYRDRGYSVHASSKGNFVVVNRGKRVEYFDNGDTFWNLYRIVSFDGTDFVTHQVPLK